MSKVYVLTELVTGPSGHGDPGREYIALATDGGTYTLGNVLPAFASYEEACEYNKNKQYLIMELEVL